MPQFTKAKRSTGRRWKVWRRPLFPGYVFVERCEELFDRVRIATGVRQSFCPFVLADGRPAELTAAAVEVVRKFERQFNAKRSKRLQFAVGDTVSVLEGPFTGLRASVYQLSDDERVTLLLDFLGRQTKVAVAASAIEGAAA